MSLAKIIEQIPEYGKDIRLNLDTIFSEAGAPGLTPTLVSSVALACAYAVEDLELAEAIKSSRIESLNAELIEATKGAATIMAMNNIYYRTAHMLEDKEIGKLPARLRMNIIGKPGVDKADFELMCLAISALAGCSACVNAHVNEVKKAGLTSDAIHSSLRIASVINAAKRARKINL